MDCIIFIVDSIFKIMKSLYTTANKKKVGMNINAAIDDWLSAKEDKKIMKKYISNNVIIDYHCHARGRTRIQRLN
jgi:hypothetical protein